MSEHISLPFAQQFPLLTCIRPECAMTFVLLAAFPAGEHDGEPFGPSWMNQASAAYCPYCAQPQTAEATAPEQTR